VNPIERVIRRVDKAQQDSTAAGFVFGVIKKYGDDNGGSLAGNLAHSALVATFPLLLVLFTGLGIVAADNKAVLTSVQGVVRRDFPVVGKQLTGNVHQLHHSSTIGLLIGLLGLLWGASGLAQAGLFTMEQVWNLPGPARPGYFQRLGRAAQFLGVLGLGMIVSTLLNSLTAYGHKSVLVAALAELLVVVSNIGMYLAAFRVLTPKGVPLRQLVPGAVAGGIGWTLLQVLGAFLLQHYIHSDSVYGIFGIMLGLIAWMYFGVEVTVYAAEINVVLSRRLWPRSIVQPPLTEADRASMALQALQNQRREEQQVTVTYTDRPPGDPAPSQTPETPDEVSPPASDTEAGSEPGPEATEAGTAEAKAGTGTAAEAGSGPVQAGAQSGPGAGAAPARGADADRQRSAPRDAAG